MQTEDIILNVSMAGEPQKLCTYCRGSLPGVLPVSAAIGIVRPWRYRPHSFYSPDFYFDQMSRTEKKRAELSISERSLRMEARESRRRGSLDRHDVQLAVGKVGSAAGFHSRSRSAKCIYASSAGHRSWIPSSSSLTWNWCPRSKSEPRICTVSLEVVLCEICRW